MDNKNYNCDSSDDDSTGIFMRGEGSLPKNQDSFPDTLYLIERLDINALAWVVCDPGCITSMHENPIHVAKKYLEACEQSPAGWIKRVQYEKGQCGRLYAFQGLSQQNLKRNIRHTIAKDYYTDLDIVNCHPTILEFICQKHNIDCPLLTKYNESRLNDAFSIKSPKSPNSPRAIKADVIKIINGGTAAFDSKSQQSSTNQDFLKGFSKEIKQVHKALTESLSTEYKEFQKEPLQGGNLLGRFVSSLMTQIESKVLFQIWKFYGNPEECVLCFDGIQLISDDHDTSSENLKRLELVIKDSMGISIKLKVKLMNELIQLPKRIPIYEGTKTTAKESRQDKLRKIVNAPYLINANPLDVHGGKVGKRRIPAIYVARKAVKKAASVTKTKITFHDYNDEHSTPVKLTESCPTFYTLSGMGSGKTFQIEKLLEMPEFSGPGVKVVIPTFRKTLATEHLSRFRKLGFKHYLDKDLPYHITDEFPKVIIQIESFRRIAWTTYPHLMFVDEAESIIGQFFSSTMKKASHVFSEFETTLRESKYAVIADAHLTDKNLTLFQRMRRKPAIIAINKHNVQKNKISLTTERMVWLNAMIEDLKKGLKVVLPLSTSIDNQTSLIETLTKRVPEIKSKTIYFNSKTQQTGENAEVLADKAKWAGYRVFSYTGTLQAGVSYEGQGEKAYHVIYAWFCNNTSIASLLQMLGRFRLLLLKRIYIYLHHVIRHSVKFMTGGQFIEYESYKRVYANEHERASYEIPDGIFFEHSGNPRNIVFPEVFRNSFFQAWVNTSVQNEKDRAFFIWRFVSKLRHIGFKGIDIMGDTKNTIQYEEAYGKLINNPLPLIPRTILNETEANLQKWLKVVPRGSKLTRHEIFELYEKFNLEELNTIHLGSRRLNLKFEADIIPFIIKRNDPAEEKLIKLLKARQRQLKDIKEGKTYNTELKANKEKNISKRAKAMQAANPLTNTEMLNIKRKLRNSITITKEEELRFTQYWFMKTWNITPAELNKIDPVDILHMLKPIQIKLRNTFKLLQKEGSIDDSLGELADMEHGKYKKRETANENLTGLIFGERCKVAFLNNILGEEVNTTRPYIKLSNSIKILRKLVEIEDVRELNKPIELINFPKKLKSLSHWLRRDQYKRLKELPKIFGKTNEKCPDVLKWAKNPKLSKKWIESYLSPLGIKIVFTESGPIQLICDSVWITGPRVLQ